jgi:hypothetical protein
LDAPSPMIYIADHHSLDVYAFTPHPTTIVRLRKKGRWGVEVFSKATSRWEPLTVVSQHSGHLQRQRSVRHTRSRLRRGRTESPDLNIWVASTVERDSKCTMVYAIQERLGGMMGAMEDEHKTPTWEGACRICRKYSKLDSFHCTL